MFSNWFVSGILSALCFSAMVLIYKKLFLMGIRPATLNLFIFGFVFIAFVVFNVHTKSNVDINLKMAILLIVAAAFSFLGNYFNVNSIELAPNPGYAATLKASNIIIVTMLAPLLFKSGLNIASFLGVLLVLIGVFVLSIASSV